MIGKWGIPLVLASPIFNNAARDASVDAPSPAHHGHPVIVIDAATDRGAVHKALLGVNNDFSANADGIWNAVKDRPRPVVVRRMRRAHISLVRYPGGTVANLFDWKKAIGQDRGCQINGHHSKTGHSAVSTGSVYGPDEHMRLVDAIGTKAMIMVPWVNESPADAADWVEYMNSPAHTPGNPNGGIDWADRRAANGHPRPYGVHFWEIGNEQRIGAQRYWMSDDTERAVHQYIDGATVGISGENLGKNCHHPRDGRPSNGAANQTFQALYPPVQPGSMRVSIAGRPWTEVTSLTAVGGHDRVYVLDPDTGNLTFGDGIHGAIPPAGDTVTADYRSVHAGFFRFMHAMRKVDPRIKVCASWGRVRFVNAARNRNYDCFTTHSYTDFRSEGHDHWNSPLQGHDWHMMGAMGENRFLARLDHALPPGVVMPLSEFGALRGDNPTYPRWARSMTHALYMATRWIQLSYLHTPWATGGKLVTFGDRGVLGAPPSFLYSAEALARQVLGYMFDHGGRLLHVRIASNPVRHPAAGGQYPGLIVGAVRNDENDIVVSVVNRLPFARQHIAARLVIRHAHLAPPVKIDSIHSRSFMSTNTREHPRAIRLTARRRRMVRPGTWIFPPHSITVLRFHLRDKSGSE